MENEKLIDELYKKYYRYLLYIAKQTVSEVDVEDIIQSVFLNLINSLYWTNQCTLKADYPEEVKSILRIFLRNACCKYHRHAKKKHEIFSETPDCDLFAISIEVEQKYDNKNLFEYIVNLDKLNERDKDIILKYYVYGYSTEELAAQTGLSTNAIKTYRHRALKYIRERLKNFNNE
ncbi:MAG: sigma-70 family RNA polymerase sigma factor [Prevotellaceae bacterium]|jgi:RNA polymerase sigma-70 factor (ECF subfamily)|nr:sigma-70 family RNA polymerase sigma factor [Prevotellaceae bacterium]